MGTERNDDDRFAHVVQGFVPAIVVRELLLLTSLTKGLVAVLTITVRLSISVGFELIEWVAAMALGAGADVFLGMRGDVWDTQRDMFLCLCGAVLARLLLRRVHDDQLP